MPDLDRVRYLTEHYYSLQGLARLPLGLFFFFAAANRVGWLPFRNLVKPTSQPLTEMLGGLMVLVWIIGRLYRRRYGAIKPRRTEQGIENVARGILWFIVYLIVAGNDAHHPERPVYVSMLLFSLPWFYIAYTQPYRKPHYLAAGILLALLSVQPLLTTDRNVAWGLTDAMIGVALVVTGIGDHRVWTRSVHDLRDGDDGQPV